jgi:hypothetical protein
MAKKSTSTTKKPAGEKKSTSAKTQSKPRASAKSRTAGKSRGSQAAQPASLSTIVVRLLPVWILLIVLLFLVPSLPIRAVTGLFNWVRDVLPDRQEVSSLPPEPEFSVEPQAAPTMAAPVALPTPPNSTEVSGVFTVEVRYWSDEIERWGRQYNLSPNLIATLMQIESCGNPDARSSEGKLGLFQVQPDLFNRRDDPLDPATNAQRALEYFGEMYSRSNGDLALAFAAYHGGVDVLSTTPAQWPNTTQRYQFWASGIYEEAEIGLRESPTLIDWLGSGGASLCQQAANALQGR